MVDHLTLLLLFLLQAAGLVLVTVACALIASGFFFRAVALALVVLNLVSVALQHPFQSLSEPQGRTLGVRQGAALCLSPSRGSTDQHALHGS